MGKMFFFIYLFLLIIYPHTGLSQLGEITKALSLSFFFSLGWQCELTAGLLCYPHIFKKNYFKCGMW